MSVQKTLPSFFPVVSKPLDQFRDFFYEPGKGKATFCASEPANARLVSTADNVRLWISNTAERNGIRRQLLGHDPLLKSYLQKAVRRMDLDNALAAAYALFLSSPQSLLRRLPIIAVEDVTLLPGTSVIVWLMMAIGVYPPTELDLQNVLGYVVALVQCRFTCPSTVLSEAGDKPQMSHKLLASSHDNGRRDELLALFYRSRYGGTDGDVQMLTNALSLYHARPDYLPEGMLQPYTGALPAEYMDYSNSNSDFLMCAIDFHCFPWMLKDLSERTGIPAGEVKRLIWQCDSAPNKRKRWTIERMEKERATAPWQRLSPLLDQARLVIRSRLQEGF